jgi:dipeptidyl aminopeptidase/acylaminoacyl peptidase
LLALGVNASLPAVTRLGRLDYSRINWQGDIWRQQIPTATGSIPPAVRFTSSSSLDLTAQYSPDGGRIAFASNRSGTGRSGRAPDGKQIVFQSSAAGNNDVFVVDAGGGWPRRLTGDKTHWFVPSWSNDGKWIYFCSTVTGRQEIWKIPNHGGDTVQVTRNGGFVSFDSPKGDALFYTKGEENATLFTNTLFTNTLFTSASDGSGETEVLRGVANRGFVVTNDKIYYLRKEPDGKLNIRERLMTTRLDFAISTVPQSVYLGLSLSPDGKFLIYSQMRVASNLMRVEDFR